MYSGEWSGFLLASLVMGAEAGAVGGILAAALGLIFSALRATVCRRTVDT
jgi:hypothetical protein